MDVPLTARLFAATGGPPRNVIVTARCLGHRQYPFVESVLSGACVQPYVHDCTLRIREGGQLTTFIFFFKKHIQLPKNRHCRLAWNCRVLRGDLLMMRTSRSGTIVNLRGGDQILVDWAVHRSAAFYSYGIKLKTFSGSLRIQPWDARLPLTVLTSLGYVRVPATVARVNIACGNLMGEERIMCMNLIYHCTLPLNIL